MSHVKPWRRRAHLDHRGGHHYLTPVQRVPGYLPYKNPVSPGDIPVPNEADMFWPQGQFAPKFFPSGSKSFTPFEFPSNEDMAESAQLILKNDEREFGDPSIESENPHSLLKFTIAVGAWAFAWCQIVKYVKNRN